MKEDMGRACRTLGKEVPTETCRKERTKKTQTWEDSIKSNFKEIL
jgi:hypothetical protein